LVVVQRHQWQIPQVVLADALIRRGLFLVVAAFRIQLAEMLQIPPLHMAASRSQAMEETVCLEARTLAVTAEQTAARGKTTVAAMRQAVLWAATAQHNHADAG
jgi:hypothetical protein